MAINFRFKLVRNAWEKYKVFKWDGHGEVRWEFLVRLVQFQSYHGLNLGNKMTELHINFKPRIMKVN